MADDIKFEKQDMFEKLALEALMKLNDSFVSVYPYLDYASMYMYDKKEIQGVPMLFELHDYYFIGYLLKFDSEIEVAVARKMTNTDFEHYDRFMKIPRFAYALSLSNKQSCISTGKIADFVSNLPLGSFIQVTGVDGTQATGFFQGISSGKIELAFGYDLEAGKFEKTTDISLYKREK